MVCCDWLFGKRAMSDVGEKHARKSNKQWGCFLFVFVVACVAGFCVFVVLCDVDVIDKWGGGRFGE